MREIIKMFLYIWIKLGFLNFVVLGVFELLVDDRGIEVFWVDMFYILVYRFISVLRIDFVRFFYFTFYKRRFRFVY